MSNPIPSAPAVGAGLPVRPAYAHAREASALVAASAADLFDLLDDQRRLGEHMAKSSAVMGGGRMNYDLDAGDGRAVGSHIRMGGEAFGLRLAVDEVVVEHAPPHRKAWRTVGTPELIVIGAYDMGFEITPAAGGCRLRVWIAYDLPARGQGCRAPALAAFYARWCVRRMVDDAVAHFTGSSRA